MEKPLYRENLAFIKARFPDKTSLKVEEVAVILNVDKKTVYNYIKRIRKPLVTMPTGSRIVRISIPALADWMSSGRSLTS